MKTRILKAAFVLGGVTLMSAALYFSFASSATSQSATGPTVAYQSRIAALNGKLNGIEQRFNVVAASPKGLQAGQKVLNSRLENDVYQYAADVNRAFQQALADAKAGRTVANLAALEDTVHDHWRRFGKLHAAALSMQRTSIGSDDGSRTATVLPSIRDFGATLYTQVKNWPSWIANSIVTPAAAKEGLPCVFKCAGGVSLDCLTCCTVAGPAVLDAFKEFQTCWKRSAGFGCIIAFLDAVG